LDRLAGIDFGPIGFEYPAPLAIAGVTLGLADIDDALSLIGH
jgi:hypothetical protein